MTMIGSDLPFPCEPEALPEFPVTLRPGSKPGEYLLVVKGARLESLWPKDWPPMQKAKLSLCVFGSSFSLDLRPGDGS